MMRWWIPRRDLMRRKRKLHLQIDRETSETPALKERHWQFRWTRRFNRVNLCGVTAITLIGALIVTVGITFCAGMLCGLWEFASFLGTRSKVDAELPPLFAGWSLVALGTTICLALRTRQNPVAPWMRPWAVTQPLPDWRLISPAFNGLLFVLLVLGPTALGALGLAGYGHDWPTPIILRIFAMAGLSILSSWLLAEFLAAVAPPTPLVQTALGLVATGCFVLAVMTAFAPRELPEIRHVQSYGLIWALPPAGCFVGLGGVIAPEGWAASCAFGLSVTGLAAYWFCRSIQLEDIRLLDGSRLSAFRRGWVRRWVRPPAESRFALLSSAPERAKSAITTCRIALLEPPDNFFSRYLCWPRVTSRQLTRLGLIGLRYSRVGRPTEYLSGLYPVIFALAMLQLNQFMSLAALPRFLRVPLLLSFALPLLEPRELASAGDRGEPTLGRTSIDTLFPYSYFDVVGALLCNHLRQTWVALPGILLAVVTLLQTDIPTDLVWQIPLMVVLMSFLAPLYLSVLTSLSGTRSSWLSMFCLTVPWSIASICMLVAICAGVVGSVLSMRLDRAWICLSVTAAVFLMLLAAHYYALRKGWFDQTAVPQSSSAFQLR